MESLMIWDLKKLAANSAIIILVNVKIVFFSIVNIVLNINKMEGDFMEYRRFKIINESQKQAFEELVAEKEISREDLILILTTVSLNQETSDSE